MNRFQFFNTSQALTSSFLVLSLAGCASTDKFTKEIDSLKTQVSDLERANQEKTNELSKYQSQLVNNSKEKTQLRSSLDEMNKRDEAQRKEFADLQLRLKKLSDAGTLSVRMIDGKLVVNLGSDILFPSGSAKLSKEGVKTITEVAQQLKSIPDKKFQVEGHTDNVPISTAIFPSNWELASARSVMVVKSMIREGFQPNNISASSYAEFSPIQPNETKEGKAANRRIAIVIIPDLSGVPGLKDMDSGRSTSTMQPIRVQQPAPQNQIKAVQSAGQIKVESPKAEVPKAPVNAAPKPTVAPTQSAAKAPVPTTAVAPAPQVETKKAGSPALGQDELE